MVYGLWFMLKIKVRVRAIRLIITEKWIQSAIHNPIYPKQYYYHQLEYKMHRPRTLTQRIGVVLAVSA